MEIIVIGLFCIDLLFTSICIICFFLLYGEKVKQYNSIRDKYIYQINVKCTLLDNKDMNRNYANWSEGYGGNSRVHYDVKRPYFQGIVNGKTYTFVRTKDVCQPVCEVGKSYTIFLRDLNNVDCRDFYEANEISGINSLIYEKKKKYMILVGLNIAIAVILLAVML